MVGAPWINGELFAEQLNKQKLPGVHFIPFDYRPFYGSMKGVNCHGVLIRITDPSTYQPLAVQYLLMGMLKSLYPKRVKEAFEKQEAGKRRLFNLANGNEEIYRLMVDEQYVAWKMIGYQKVEREQFKEARKKYLLYH